MRRFLLILWPAALGLVLLLGPDRATGRARLRRTQLTARHNGPNVCLDWAVTDETDVAGYDLYRRAATDPAYQLVRRWPAAGRRHYRCLDAGAYRLAGGAPLAYRLITRCLGPDQSQVLLADAPGAVERSWDTIKEVFK